MPRGDGTGPMGMGPMTGRGVGFCAGFVAPGYTSSGIGYGMGFGRGRRFRRMFYITGVPGWVRYGYPAYDQAYASVVDEKELLGNQVELLENQLLQVKKRLEELNDETE